MCFIIYYKHATLVTAPTTTPPRVCADGSHYTYLGHDNKDLFSSLFNDTKNSESFEDLLDGQYSVKLPAMEISTFGVFLTQEQSQLMEFSFGMVNVPSFEYIISLSNKSQIIYEVGC